MNIIQIYKNFPTPESCIKHLEKVRWNENPTCPYCKSKRQTPLKNEHRYHCNSCNTSYSVTVGTIFHKTKIDLQKWFLAISLVLNAKKGISARQLMRDIEVNKNTAWYMLMRLRRAMIEHGELLKGLVEADETYIGGKDKNKHNDKRGGGTQGRNTKDKVAVFGVLEREGKVKAGKVKDVSKRTLHREIYEKVEKGTQIFTDEWKSYVGLTGKFKHDVVRHSSGQYVKGLAHTNTLEGFWSLLKRGIVGQYHQVSKRHVGRYIDEFCFRYNNRKNDNIFTLLLSKSVNL